MTVFPLFATVGEYVLGVACVYGQVIKTRRNNRVISVERKLKLGSKDQLADALLESRRRS